jgi:uncharacterized protein (TIGR00255 family)
MLSMTGYGRKTEERDGRQMTVELRSVNHRYLDLSFRMPRALNYLEDASRKLIAGHVARGHMDIYYSYRNAREDSKTVAVDKTLLSAYSAAFDEICGATGARDDRVLAHYLGLNDIFIVTEPDEDKDALSELALFTLEGALCELNAVRAREGESLKRDMEARLIRLDELIGDIERRYPDTIIDYNTKLRQRVLELMDGAAVDEARFIQEVAFMADRSAIAEEIVRLKSHLTQYREDLSLSEPIGRKLDFLLQEFNREVNTISSKSQDIQITQLTLAAKAEIEKLREQAQNIE